MITDSGVIIPCKYFAYIKTGCLPRSCNVLNVRVVLIHKPNMIDSKFFQIISHFTSLYITITLTSQLLNNFDEYHQMKCFKLKFNHFAIGHKQLLN